MKLNRNKHIYLKFLKKKKELDLKECQTYSIQFYKNNNSALYSRGHSRDLRALMPYSWILLKKKEEDVVQVNQSFDVDEYYIPILFHPSENILTFFGYS